MADHTAQTTVDADPGAVYEYLADVSHLPDYFPMITRAEPVTGEDAVRTTAVLQPEEQGEPAGAEPKEVHGEVWFRCHDDERRIEWGSEGRSSYHGELRVEAAGDGSRIRLLIHSEHEHDGIDESIGRSLDSIATQVGPAGDGA